MTIIYVALGGIILMLGILIGFVLSCKMKKKSYTPNLEEEDIVPLKIE
jgi:hypothetical protein